MYPLNPDRRDVAVAHAERHSDPMVREAIRALQEENAVLREVIAEDRPVELTRDGRRFIGRILMTLILVGGVIVGVAVAAKGRSSSAFREGFRQGVLAAPTAPIAPPALPTPPTPPTPPTLPSPRR